MKVLITTIEHRHGTNVYANATEAGALDALYGYVLENWDRENVGEEPTDDDEVGDIDQYDKATAVEIYFNAVEDESWILSPEEVGP